MGSTSSGAGGGNSRERGLAGNRARASRFTCPAVRKSAEVVRAEAAAVERLARLGLNTCDLASLLDPSTSAATGGDGSSAPTSSSSAGVPRPSSSHGRSHPPSAAAPSRGESEEGLGTSSSDSTTLRPRDIVRDFATARGRRAAARAAPFESNDAAESGAGSAGSSSGVGASGGGSTGTAARHETVDSIRRGGLFLNHPGEGAYARVRAAFPPASNARTRLSIERRMFHTLARVPPEPQEPEDPEEKALRVAETFGHGQALHSNRPEPCCICLEPLLKAQVALTLSCGHLFHEACIHEWLDRKAFCPLCRTRAH